MSRSRIVLALIAVVAILLLVAPMAWRRVLWDREQNELLRGRRLAAEVGCVVCHRPYRGTEIPNPGSRWGTVPRFEAGNAMMYVESKAEIEEFIRHGVPLSWGEDPAAAQRLEVQRLRMPAYQGRLQEDEIADLTAWTSVVEGVDLAGKEATTSGRRLAREHGCLSCHGTEGSGGLPNPGSMAGFIPGFLGRNFTSLVQSREEFDEWVRTGTLERLEASWIARRTWRRQAIAMPAYGDELTDEELGLLWDWVGTVRSAHLDPE